MNPYPQGHPEICEYVKLVIFTCKTGADSSKGGEGNANFINVNGWPFDVSLFCTSTVTVLFEKAVPFGIKRVKLPPKSNNNTFILPPTTIQC